MQRVPMTVEGEQMLRKELEHLKHSERPRIVKAIAEAREQGDLKENAEYHAAREQQSFIEGRIADLEGKLAMAQVIDIKKIPHQGHVVFGATVDLINVDKNENVTYKIVGEDEANLEQGKISVHSPIARALIGKAEGEEAVVVAPGGDIPYEIVKIRYE